MKKTDKIIGYGLLFIILIAITYALDSSDIDELCNNPNSLLYRNNQTWGCGQINWTDFNITYINENITYIRINDSHLVPYTNATKAININNKSITNINNLTFAKSNAYFTSATTTSLGIRGTTNFNFGTDGSGVQVNFQAVDGTNEGGQFNLNGAGANNDWSIDNYAGGIRYFTGGNVYMQMTTNNLILGNNYGIQLKDNTSTARAVAKISTGNILQIGANGGNVNTYIYSGTTTANMQISNSGRVTFNQATTSTASVRLGTDVDLYRGATNTMYLASGDSLNLVSGSITANNITSRDNIFYNVTDEITLPISRFQLPATNYPQQQIIGLTPVLSFDKNTEESVYGCIHTPTGYKAGTIIDTTKNAQTGTAFTRITKKIFGKKQPTTEEKLIEKERQRRFKEQLRMKTPMLDEKTNKVKYGNYIVSTETGTSQENTIQKSKALEGQTFEASSADSVTLGLSTWGIVKASINPKSISQDMVETRAEKIVVKALQLIRMMMWIMFGVEIYMFIINQKTS